MTRYGSGYFGAGLPDDQPIPERNEMSDEEFNKLYAKFRVETDLILKFNLFLELYCPDDYAHLIDTDDNAGEFMREAIRQNQLQMLEALKKKVKGVAVGVPCVPLSAIEEMERKIQPVEEASQHVHDNFCINYGKCSE